jgi:acyl-coenzyme A synthetase/AMP-(fatty) acid ligase
MPLNWRLVFVDGFPRVPSGKIQQAKLRAARST